MLLRKVYSDASCKSFGLFDNTLVPSGPDAFLLVSDLLKYFCLLLLGLITLTAQGQSVHRINGRQGRRTEPAASLLPARPRRGSIAVDTHPASSDASVTDEAASPICNQEDDDDELGYSPLFCLEIEVVRQPEAKVNATSLPTLQHYVGTSAPRVMRL